MIGTLDSQKSEQKLPFLVITKEKFSLAFILYSSIESTTKSQDLKRELIYSKLNLPANYHIISLFINLKDPDLKMKCLKASNVPNWFPGAEPSQFYPL